MGLGDGMMGNSLTHALREEKSVEVSSECYVNMLECKWDRTQRMRILTNLFYEIGPTTSDGCLSTRYHMTYRHGVSYLTRLTVLQKQDKRLACERNVHPSNLFLVAETAELLSQRIRF